MTKGAQKQSESKSEVSVL